MTPRQLQALMDRRAYRDAFYICSYANMKRGKGDPVLTPESLLAPKPVGGGVFAAFQKAFDG